MLNCPVGKHGVPDQIPVQRRLAAILAGDVVGYSRLMGIDEVGTLNALKAIRRELADPAIASHHGRIVKTTGDGILIEFPSVVDAVACAVVIQDGMAARNVDVPEDKRIVFRIGINIGDIIIDEGDIHGDGVNVAARLEGLAHPGDICISGAAHDQVSGKLDVTFEDMGEQSLKNIARPVRAFKVVSTTVQAAASSSAASKRPDRPALVLPDKPSLAVLPFQNMSGDPEQEYFADGMVEDITTALSRVRSLFVIARNSSFTYKAKAVDVKQVGRELGVRYVVEGSVRKAGSRIRITSQLIDAEAGRHIWAEKYDRELREIFDVQDEITQAIAASVQTQVDLHEGDIASRHKSSDLSLWGLLKRAWRRFLDLDQAAIEDALQLVEEALHLDPNSSDAYALKSVAVYHLALIDYASPDRRDRIARARDIAVTAVKLDDKSEFAHWVLGNARSWLAEGDYGLSSYHRALELNPNFSLAYGLMGSALIASGRPAEGIEANLTAIRSNPRDPSIFFRYFDIARAHFALENDDAAIEWAQKSIGNKKGWISSHLILIAALAHSGRVVEAKSAVKLYLEEFPDACIGDVFRGQFMPYRDRLVAGLRIAGLPE
jgi:adenylate cyclase